MAKSLEVNAKDLVRLLKREWRMKREPNEDEGANGYRRGWNTALDRLAALLSDDEARSTISIDGRL